VIVVISTSQLPEQYRKVEDLWLSYVAHQLGWRVRRIKMKGVVLMENVRLKSNTEMSAAAGSTALWRTIKQTKIDMLKDLRRCGWNV